MESPGDRPLSSRQREVLPLLAEGLTDDEIGACLRISEATVKKHVRRLLDHYNAASRAGVVLQAIAAGDLAVNRVKPNRQKL